ncbi:secretory phospholipase A2 [Pyrenophora teres f. maculata]|nr:secretory phospholipase A2 [Pyrenophora teres f. maculata]
MKVAIVTAVVGLASLALCAPIALDDHQNSLENITDDYLFNIPLEQFIEYRNAHTGPAELDWTSDSCTLSPDKPWGFDFTASCRRHDFGYWNYIKQKRITSANRARVDRNFKQDMYNQCAKEKWLKRQLCKATAKLYYKATNKFGGVWAEAEAEEE